MKGPSDPQSGTKAPSVTAPLQPVLPSHGAFMQEATGAAQTGLRKLPRKKAVNRASVSTLNTGLALETLVLVLMAGFALRAMNSLRTTVEGGLKATLVLLDVLHSQHREPIARSPSARGDASAGARTVGAVREATGLPRETAARILRNFARSGDLSVHPDDGYCASAGTRLRFSRLSESLFLPDFLMVTARVGDVLGAPASGHRNLLTRFPWQAAMSTTHGDIRSPSWIAELEGVRRWLRDLSPAERDQCLAVADAYLYRHLVRLSRTFEHDLLLPLLIGEIAHRNLGIISQGEHAQRTDESLGRVFNEPWSSSDPSLLPVNAYSLSASMAIPYSTIQRKIAYLMKRGWIGLNQGRSLALVAGAIRAYTKQLDTESIADFRSCHNALSEWALLPRSEVQ